MKKNNRWNLIVTSILILLPILFGVIVWDRLPETMTTHWGADGVADGHSGRLFAVLGLPLIIFALHLLIFFVSKLDKNVDRNPRMFGIILWIMPAVSLIANGIMYAAAFDVEPRIELAMIPFIGILFVAMGNYLPKCRQNNTMGIKIKWTLENEENWNATHRFAGKVWVFGGLLVILSVFLPIKAAVAVMVAAMILLIIIPFVYSWLYHRKQVKNGVQIVPAEKSKAMKIAEKVSIIIVPIILVLVAFLMFAGNMEVRYDDTSFTVECDFYSDLTVEYDAVDSVRYMDDHDAGVRTAGLGSARLQAGLFRSDDFGSYTRYAYVGCDACVVLDVDGKTLVICGADAQSTGAIYDELTARCTAAAE